MKYLNDAEHWRSKVLASGPEDNNKHTRHKYTTKKCIDKIEKVNGEQKHNNNRTNVLNIINNKSKMT